VSITFDPLPAGAAAIWGVVLDFFTRTGVLRDKYFMTLPKAPRGAASNQSLVRVEEVLSTLREERATSFTLRYDSGTRSQVISLAPSPRSRLYWILTVGSQILDLIPPKWTPLIEDLAKTVRLGR
jgi:hypothetical protein